MAVVGESNPSYWLGYLGATLKMIARDYPDTKAGKEAARSVREFESSPAMGKRQTVAFAIVDQTDALYAIRYTKEEATAALGAAAEYLDGALRSGHSLAAGWVEERLPFAILTVTDEERIEMLENGTPILDREP